MPKKKDQISISIAVKDNPPRRRKNTTQYQRFVREYTKKTGKPDMADISKAWNAAKRAAARKGVDINQAHINFD